MQKQKLEQIATTGISTGVGSSTPFICGALNEAQMEQYFIEYFTSGRVVPVIPETFLGIPVDWNGYPYVSKLIEGLGWSPDQYIILNPERTLAVLKNPTDYTGMAARTGCVSVPAGFATGALIGDLIARWKENGEFPLEEALLTIGPGILYGGTLTHLVTEGAKMVAESEMPYIVSLDPLRLIITSMGSIRQEYNITLALTIASIPLGIIAGYLGRKGINKLRKWRTDRSSVDNAYTTTSNYSTEKHRLNSGCAIA